MTETQLYQAAHQLKSMGSFAGYIGNAYFVADYHNRETLVQAFKGLFHRAYDLSDTTTTQEG